MADVATTTALDWATFGAVALTAVAAGIAVGYTARTDRRAVDRERRAQASSVAVWVENGVYLSNLDPPGWSAFEVVVYNGSEAPIHDVRVDRLPNDWKKTSDYAEAASVSVVLPRSESPPMPFAEVVGEVKVFHGIPEAPPLRLHFRDNAGVRWVRYPDGSLDEDS
jgi:hypothetical protein